MKKPLSQFQQGIVIIVIGVLFYLADCLIAHKSHLEVSWIQSGIYNKGPLGFLASSVFVLGGIYLLLPKRN